MKKKRITISVMILFSMIAVTCYFFANNESMTKMTSSNVEALVSVSNAEYHLSGCGTVVEEWCEPENPKATNLHYTALKYHEYSFMDCNSNAWLCRRDRMGATKGPHDDTQDKCFHPKNTNFYPNSQDW